MYRIITVTAISALLAGPAAAQVVVPTTDVTFEVPTEVEYDGYAYDETFDVETQDLEGEAVWSSISNERIGDVDEVMSVDGTMYVKMDIGGFLGIGDKDIAVPMDQARIYVNQDDDDVRVYLNATEEQLETYPAITE